MSRPVRLQVVSKPGDSSAPDTITYLPHGTHTLKLLAVPGEGTQPQRLSFAPLRRHPQEHVVAGHEDGDGRDLWVTWGGGKPAGYPLDLTAGERYVYFDIIHRGAQVRPSYNVTIVGTAGEREVVRQTFHLIAPDPPNDDRKPGHFAWTPVNEQRSELVFTGDAVPEYLSRWWPSSELHFRPVPSGLPFPPTSLRLLYERLAEGDSFGRITAHWGDATGPLMQIAGRLEVSLYDTRLFSADLFHLAADRYYVLRLWFRWLYQQFSADDLVAFLAAEEKTENRRQQALADARFLNGLLDNALPDEIPDAERFDVLLDAQTGHLLYAGTDLHWQEMWGSVPKPESLAARILPFGLQNLTYALITRLRAREEREGRDERFDPADTLRKWALQGFPGERSLEPTETRRLSLPFQAHVPKYQGLRFSDSLTSGDVKRSRPVSIASEPDREEDDMSANDMAEWTIMVYMAGDNGILLADPMEAAGYEDLEEMKKVGSSNNIHVLAQFDTRHNRQTYRYRLRSGTDLADDLVQTIPESNTGDPANLVDFIVWAAREYPAKKTMLILWNHGNGWDDEDLYASFRTVEDRLDLDSAETRAISQRSRFRQALFHSTLTQLPQEAARPGQRGILYDDSSMDFLDNQELKRALADAVRQAGLEQIDVLGMDACLMAMLEVAYQTRETCSYLVSSEEVEPMRGWPYDDLLRALAAEPQASAHAVAKQAVAQFVKSYDRGILSPDVTLSAIESAQLTPLVEALDTLSLALLRRMHETAIFEAIALARRKAQRFQKDGYVDLAHFLRLLLERRPNDMPLQTAVQPVLEALGPGRAVAANDTLGSGVEQAAGVAIYFPERGSSPDDGLTALYARLDFAADCHWPALLIHYHAARQAYYERRPLPPWQPPDPDTRRAGPDAVPAEGASPPFDRRRLTVRVVAGSITDEPADCIVVNHVAGMDCSGAEGYVNGQLGGALHYFAQQGSMTGRRGELFFVPTAGRVAAPLVCVAGLGETARFDAIVVRQIGRSVSQAAWQLQLSRIATIVHGAGTGGVDVAESVQAFLSGAIDALGESDPQQQVAEITLVEIDAKKLPAIRAAVEAAQSAHHSRFEIVLREGQSPGEAGLLRARLERARTEILGVERRLTTVALGPEVTEAPPRPVSHPQQRYYLDATYEDDTISYVFAGAEGVAEVPEISWPVQSDFIRELLGAVEVLAEHAAGDAEAASRNLDALGQQMRHYLLRDDLQAVLDALDPAGHLILRLDSNTALLPWELLQVGGEPLAVHFSMARVLKRQVSHIRLRPLRLADSHLRALIIADPADNLPGAADEGRQLGELFGEHPNISVKVWEQKEPGPYEIVAALEEGRYDLVHYAGHAFYDPQSPERSAWVLSADGQKVLTAQAIGRMEAPPLLVVSNACQTGQAGGWEESHDGARGLAEAFLAAGGRNIVGTFWRIDDSLSVRFATTFYRHLLGGEPLGKALRATRRALIEQEAWDYLTWASYLLYGDPTLVLAGGATRNA